MKLYKMMITRFRIQLEVQDATGEADLSILDSLGNDISFKFHSGPEPSTFKSAASTTQKSKVTPVKFNDSFEDEVSEDNIPLSTIKKDLKRKKAA
ncbi:hypothetical protein LINGRAHAP2_LOCUS14157 [Linum grandiflorum]